LTQFAGAPGNLSSPAAAETGNDLLARVFGSGGTTGIISTMAEKAGISSSIVQKMLPMVATLVGSGLAKRISTGGNMSDLLGELADAGGGGIGGAIKNLTSKMFG